MAWSGRALRGLADPHRALEGYRTIPAPDDGGRREENAPVAGQPRDAHSALFLTLHFDPREGERITR
jgi:hypothetical protein